MVQVKYKNKRNEMFTGVDKTGHQTRRYRFTNKLFAQPNGSAAGRFGYHRPLTHEE